MHRKWNQFLKVINKHILVAGLYTMAVCCAIMGGLNILAALVLWLKHKPIDIKSLGLNIAMIIIANIVTYFIRRKNRRLKGIDFELLLGIVNLISIFVMIGCNGDILLLLLKWISRWKIINPAEFGGDVLAIVISGILMHFTNKKLHPNQPKTKLHPIQWLHSLSYAKYQDYIVKLVQPGKNHPKLLTMLLFYFDFLPISAMIVTIQQPDKSKNIATFVGEVFVSIVAWPLCISVTYIIWKMYRTRHQNMNPKMRQYMRYLIIQQYGTEIERLVFNRSHNTLDITFKDYTDTLQLERLSDEYACYHHENDHDYAYYELHNHDLKTLLTMKLNPKSS